MVTNFAVVIFRDKSNRFYAVVWDVKKNKKFVLKSEDGKEIKNPNAISFYKTFIACCKQLADLKSIKFYDCANFLKTS